MQHVFIKCIKFLIQGKLLKIWKGEPCHVAKAKIGKIVIHHGSFHSLKLKGFLNDEVNIAEQ